MNELPAKYGNQEKAYRLLNPLILCTFFLYQNHGLCQILEALNKGEIPSTGSLVEVFNKGILERCLKLYSDRMATLSLPFSEESLQKNNEGFREETMKVFDEEHFGRHHAERSVEKLDEEIEKVWIMLKTSYHSQMDLQNQLFSGWCN